MGKNLGEMDPQERAAIIRRASEAFQRALTANADSISAVMDAVDVLDAPVPATPREVDEELAGLHAKSERLSTEQERLRDQMRAYLGQRKVRDGRRLAWARPFGETLEAIQELARGENAPKPWASRMTPSQMLELDATLMNQQARAQLRIGQLDDAYRARPWSRFFPCTNTGGHIHSSLHCSTLHPTTQMAWMPSLSGKSEADAVAQLGPILCSVCFPSAPVEWRQDPKDVPTPEKAARQAAREERERVKARKNLLPGEVITVGRGQWYDRITTVAAAKDALRKEVEFRDYYGHGPHGDHPAWAEAAQLAAQVLLEREAREAGTGATQEQIDKIIANAVKKNRAEGARI